MPPRPRPAAGNRVVLYVRVSALMGRAGDSFHSPELQAAAMRRTTTTQGLREVAVVDDIDVTGRTFSRVGLDKIRAMVAGGQVDVVAVYDLSRLGRDAAEALQFIRWLRDRGVGILSTVERIDDSPEGQFILGQFLGLAQLYSDQLGRRWSELIAHRAKLGRPHGPPPIGYHRAEDKSARATVDPVVGPVVTAVFGDYGAGRKVSPLAHRLAAARGKPTSLNAVKLMLCNPFYRGQVPVWGNASRTARTRPVAVYGGHHEPLVDDDTWRRVQDRIAADSWTPARLLAVSHELVGLVWCAGRCTGRLVLHAAPRDVARLRCRHVVQKTGGCGGCGSPPLAGVIDVVLGRAAKYIELLRVDRQVEADVAARADQAVEDRAALTRGRGEVTAALLRLTDGWARGLVPDDAYREQAARYQAQEQALTQRLSAVTAPASRDSAMVANLAKQLLSMWPQLSVEERNLALRPVVARVMIRAADRWREPVEDRVDVEFC